MDPDLPRTREPDEQICHQVLLLCFSEFPQINPGTSSPQSDFSFLVSYWSQTGATAGLDSEQLLVLDSAGPD